MIPAMARTIPRGSICRNFSVQVALAGMAVLGVEKKKKMMAAETPPMGRLM
jgi:hypothetical protein